MQFTVYQSSAQSKATQAAQKSVKPDPSNFSFNKEFFIENKGQWPSEVLFLTKIGGLNAWITRHGVTYDFYKIISQKDKNEERFKNNITENRQIEGQVVRLSFQGETKEIEPKGTGKLPTKINYIIGSDRSKYVSGANCYSEALITNIYNQIDARYYYDEGRIRYDYVVNPGGSVSEIMLNIEGASGQNVNADGELVFNTRFGDVKQAKLYTYQETNGKKQEIESKFIALPNGKIGFSTGIYDKEKPLIIDPVVWCTYLGGSTSPTSSPFDIGMGIAVNENLQAVYVTGSTFATNFPITSGLYSSTNSGNSDGYVSKLSYDGKYLLASTYIGGSGYDEFAGIDINTTTNNVFLVGQTGSTDYPVEPSSVSSSYSGGLDVVVTIVNQNLDGTSNNLIYSRYWGGSGMERGFGIQADQSTSTNSYYFSGLSYYQTGSFPTTTILSPVPATLGHKSAFVTRIDFANTPANSWTRYLFGTNTSGEGAFRVDLDASNDVYVVGETYSLDFSPPSGGTTSYYLPSGSTDDNAFITKLNSSGSIDYSTVVGGTYQDVYFGIDSYEGYAYTVGWTYSNNLLQPISSNPSTTTPLTSDILISYFDQSGALINNRYYGGTLSDHGFGIAVNNHSVVITGAVRPTNFSTTQCSVAASSNFALVVATLEPTLNTVSFSRVFGGTSYQDFGYDIDLVGDEDYFIVGCTESPSSPQYEFPITHNAYQLNFGGDYDAFVMHLTPEPITVTCTSSLVSICPGTSTVLTGHGADIYSFSTGTPSTPSATPFTTPTLTTTTIYTVTGYDALDLSCSATTTITLTVGCSCSNAPSGTPILTNPTTADFTSGSILTPVAINGVFSVTGTTTIYNTNVYFLAGSKIVVDPNETLQIYGSTLDGCMVHWDGIELDGTGGANHITVSNSTISHMTNGIQASNYAEVDLVNSDFLINAYQSVYLYNLDLTCTNCGIHGNLFQTTGTPGLWAPYNSSLGQSQHGIVIDDVYQVDIGGTTVNSGNTFEDLNNGVMAKWGIYNSLPTIGIHNGTFHNIHHIGSSNNDILTNAYGTSDGAAIYTTSPYGEIPGIYGMALSVDNQNTTSVALPLISECDKAIAGVNSGLTANHLKIDDCLLGVILAASGNSYSIVGNEIKDAHIGISIRDYHEQVDIGYNDILVNAKVVHPSGVHFPIGIRIDMGNPNIYTPSLSHVYLNNIELAEIAGTGIEYSAVPSVGMVNENYIQFTTTLTSSLPTGYDYNGLYGIRMLDCIEPSLIDNRVDGLTNSSAFHARMSYGYHFENNQSSTIKCNKIKYSAYGFYVRGENLATVKYNKCRNNVYPWYFDTGSSTSLASFGHVGNSTEDFANEFVYGGSSNSSLSDNVAGVTNAGTSPDYYKVYRYDNVTALQPTYIIKTNISMLDPNESGSNVLGNYYNVTNTSLIGTTPDCNADASFKTTSSTNTGAEAQYQHYLDVASNDVNYANYPDVGVWLDAMNLFSVLSKNIDLRNSSSALESFYQSNSNSLIGQLNSVQGKISLVKKTGDKSLDYLHFQQAKQANTAISSSLSYVQKLKQLNALKIKALYSSYASLDSNELITIQEVAHECYYSQGLAVKIAREIWSYYNPSELFDDRAECVDIADKNNAFDYESYMAGTRDQNSATKTNTDVIVYPNPASNQLSIYTSKASSGNFSLYNPLGQKIFECQFADVSGLHSLKLPSSISNGIYYYSYLINTGASFSGKVTICK